MLRHGSFAARVVALAVSLLVLAPAHAQDAERLRIHGSATMGTALVPALVRHWLRDSGYGEVRDVAVSPARREIRATRDGEAVIVEIVGNGTAAGFADLVDQAAELAMATRTPTAAERDAAWQLGDLDAADQAFTVALGGVQFVVDARSPVRALSTAQLRDVFAGRIARWSALGGADRPIRTAWTGPRTAAGEQLVDAVMRGAPVRAQVLAATARVTDPDLIRALPLGVAVPQGQRAIAVSDGGVAVAPERANVLGEDYPLVRRYTLYGGPLMSALGRSLATYAISLRGQRAVESTGAIAVLLRPVRGPTPPPAAIAADAVRGATRLPVTLRFHPGGVESILDARAVRDVERVDALLRAPGLRGRAVVVVAFVDRQRGGRLVAEQFANDRADYIATLLLQRGVRVVRAQGFGDRAPLADGDGARHRNERVELWLQ